MSLIDKLNNKISLLQSEREELKDELKYLNNLTEEVYNEIHRKYHNNMKTSRI